MFWSPSYLVCRLRSWRFLRVKIFANDPNQIISPPLRQVIEDDEGKRENCTHPTYPLRNCQFFHAGIASGPVATPGPNAHQNQP